MLAHAGDAGRGGAVAQLKAGGQGSRDSGVYLVQGAGAGLWGRRVCVAVGAGVSGYGCDWCAQGEDRVWEGGISSACAIHHGSPQLPPSVLPHLRLAGGRGWWQVLLAGAPNATENTHSKIPSKQAQQVWAAAQTGTWALTGGLW